MVRVVRGLRAMAERSSYQAAGSYHFSQVAVSVTSPPSEHRPTPKHSVVVHFRRMQLPKVQRVIPEQLFNPSAKLPQPGPWITPQPLARMGKIPWWSEVVARSPVGLSPGRPLSDRYGRTSTAPLLISDIGYQSTDGGCKISRMAYGTPDSRLADLFTHWSMWWAQRTERRLAVRRYRLELKATRRQRITSAKASGSHWPAA